MPVPMTMDSVIVFGDSLSDIGRKWKTKAGKMAIGTGQMYVSSSGRFSDCRNWTDFMIEEATGLTLVGSSPAGTVALSKMHLSLNDESMFAIEKKFQYANYAEGGACGDTPASLAAFLGTFKAQVDLFESDVRDSGLNLGNTLFFVWFGANDLYTAGRKPEEMHLVADAVADKQRHRLAKIVEGNGGQSRFIFVNLARALTSVRYTKQLEDAESALIDALNKDRSISQGKIVREVPAERKSRMWYAQQALDYAAAENVTEGRFRSKARAVRDLKQKLDAIKGFEVGVVNYNASLWKKALSNDDTVAPVGNVLSEETISRLFEGNYGLMAGAMTTRAEHVSSAGYSTSAKRPITTIDEVHPTDQMYKIIWGEIYDAIKRSQSTFGNLAGFGPESVLTALFKDKVRDDFRSVLQDIRDGVGRSARL